MLLQKTTRTLARQRWGLDFFWGIFIGVLFFLVVYGPSTLNVTYDSWIYAGYMEWDIVQRYAGWMYFREAGWSWPLTLAENLAQPLGVSVAFTDSVPLVALFFKLLSPVLPGTFQYIGWYNLMNCALQGGFAVLLLRHFDVSRKLALPASLLFLSYPIFVERLFRHDGLASQWIILAAFLCYFKARRGAFPKLGFLLLCCLAPGIHSYFLPMVFALLLAALLEYMLREKLFLKPALYFGLCMLATLAVMYPLGLLTRGGGEPGGFGEFSLNLNALFNPSSFDDYAESKTFGWSRLLPLLPQRHRQYDGFNYMGAGVLAGCLLAFAWLAGRLVAGAVRKNNAFARRVASMLKSHAFMLGVCLIMAVFSLSNVVTWNEQVLFTVPLPGFILRLCAVFRSSGRFFWPLSYLVLLSLLLLLARLPKPRWQPAALALLLAVQLFDVSGALWQKHTYFNSGPIVANNEFESADWVYFAENCDTICCLGPIFDYDMAAGVIRYNPDVQTNILLANRGNFGTVHEGYAPALEFLRSGAALPDGTLYLCTDDETLAYAMDGIHENARAYRTGRYRIITNYRASCPAEAYTPFQEDFNDAS